jgi:hypothetical protein
MTVNFQNQTPVDRAEHRQLLTDGELHRVVGGNRAATAAFERSSPSHARQPRSGCEW